MAYCDRADIEARIGRDATARLADIDMLGMEDPDALPRAITDAAADIDAALGIRWPECIGQTTPLLTRLAVDLAVGHLARGPQRTEEITERHEAAEKSLKAIAAGSIRPCGAAAVGGSVGDVQFAPGRRVFDGGIY